MPDNRQFVLKNRIVVKVKWERDEDADTSYYGSWSDNGDRDYVIDRKLGLFLGRTVAVPDIRISLTDVQPILRARKDAHVAILNSVDSLGQSEYYRTGSNDWGYWSGTAIEEQFPSPEFVWSEEKGVAPGSIESADTPRYRIAPQDVFWPVIDNDGVITQKGWEAAQNQIEAKIKELRLYIPDDDITIEFDDDERQEFYLDSEVARELLRDNLGNTWQGSGYFRFYEPSTNYAATDYQGEQAQEYIGYVLHDWERLEDYNNQGWGYSGCVVEIWVNGVEIAFNSLWGIEDDDDDEENYWTEYVPDIFSEALHEAQTWAADNGSAKLRDSLKTLTWEKVKERGTDD